MGVDWVMAATDAPLLSGAATKRAKEMSELNERVQKSSTKAAKVKGVY